MVKIRDFTVIGSFQQQKDALQAIDSLCDAGFAMSQIGLVAREWTEGEEHQVVSFQHHTGTSALTGAATGAGLGALAGAIGATLVPGIGPVLAGGLLVATLGGATMGAVAGTFAAPFLALHFTEEDALSHAGDVEKGRTLVIVQTNWRKEEAQALLRQHGAYDDSGDRKP
jgi:hypothetical protein